MLQVFLLNLRWGKPRAGTELGSVPGFSVTYNCGPNFLLPAWLDLESTWKHTSRCFCEGLQKEVSLPSKRLQSCQSCVLNETGNVGSTLHISPGTGVLEEVERKKGGRQQHASLSTDGSLCLPVDAMCPAASPSCCSAFPTTKAWTPNHEHK